jgi:hypothetical protein
VGIFVFPVRSRAQALLVEDHIIPRSAGGRPPPQWYYPPSAFADCF